VLDDGQFQVLLDRLVNREIFQKPLIIEMVVVIIAEEKGEKNR